MAAELIFVTGGVRSGKSEWAFREALRLAESRPARPPVSRVEESWISMSFSASTVPRR